MQIIVQARYFTGNVECGIDVRGFYRQTTMSSRPAITWIFADDLASVFNANFEWIMQKLTLAVAI